MKPRDINWRRLGLTVAITYVVFVGIQYLSSRDWTEAVRQSRGAVTWGLIIYGVAAMIHRELNVPKRAKPSATTSGTSVQTEKESK